MTTSTSDLGPFVTRVSLGLVALAHSVYLKVFVFTLPGTASFFASIGLPPASAYLVLAIETVAGLALIAGYRVRIAAASLLPVMLGATWAHSANGWLFTNEGGGWEYPLLLAALSVGQIFLGAGRYALDGRERAALAPQPSRA